MKKFAIAFICICSIIGLASGQVSTNDWTKCYGGSADEASDPSLSFFGFTGSKTIPTTDGGYLIITNSYSNSGDLTGNKGGSDCWVIKTNSIGGIIWQKNLGGPGDDFGTGACQTVDGGYVISATTNSVSGDVSGNHGGFDCWIVKLNSTGTIQWTSTLGGTADDYVNSLVLTSDGGFAFAGRTQSNDGNVSGNHGGIADFWVVKLNSSGVLQWQKCLGGSASDRGWSIFQNSDGGYICSGITSSNDGDVSGNHGNSDLWVVRLNSQGQIVWQRCLGGSNFESGSSRSKQLTDGSFVVCGITTSNDGDVSLNRGGNDIWLLKLSSSGNITWQKTFGGSQDENSADFIQTSQGGFMLTGTTSSGDGDFTSNQFAIIYGTGSCFLIQTDSLGNLVWKSNYGGSAGTGGQSIAAVTGGGFIVSGNTVSNDFDATGNHGLSDAWIAKFSFSPCAGNLPPVITADGPTTFCAGNSVNLKSDVVGGTYQWKKNGVNVSSNGTSRTYKATATGSYTCVATCNGTALTSNAIQVTSKTNASVTVTATGATSFCVGDSVTLNCTNLGSNYSVQWYRTNISIENATNYTQVVKQPGTYKVVSKNLTTGCSRISSSSVVVAVNCRLANPDVVAVDITESDFDAATREAESKGKIYIYPNPTSDNKFTVELMGLDLNGDATLEVYNAMGQVLSSEIVNITNGSLNRTIQIDEQSKGQLCLVRLIAGSEVYDSKVIIK